MNEDWRQFYRKAGEPPIQVGDMIRGMSRGKRDKKGQWVEKLAQVKAVELLTTKSDGGRIYRVILGEDVPGSGYVVG